MAEELKNKKTQPVVTEEVISTDDNNEALEKAKSFWDNNKKTITYCLLAIVLVLSGWVGYNELIKKPKELKANESIFMAENLFVKMSTNGFNKDSVNLVLNGGNFEGNNMIGLLKVISNNGGTPAANRASYIVGACYLQIKEYDKAIKYLKEFSGNGADQIQSKAYLLIGHAYSEKNNTAEALNYYKKAAEVNEKDESATPDALMVYAAYSEQNGKNDEAIAAYKKVKNNFPTFPASSNGDVEKRLARLGELNP
jgi:predicted negative regulator of RcsB-dependent stress response